MVTVRGLWHSLSRPEATLPLVHSLCKWQGERNKHRSANCLAGRSYVLGRRRSSDRGRWIIRARFISSTNSKIIFMGAWFANQARELDLLLRGDIFHACILPRRTPSLPRYTPLLSTTIVFEDCLMRTTSAVRSSAESTEAPTLCQRPSVGPGFDSRLGHNKNHFCLF